MNRTVSVIIPTYNRAGFIGECLDSILAQTEPALEVIVVDDGSEDNTVEVLKPYGDRIRYIHKENGGRASAVNAGLKIAQGEWTWLFDDDDFAFPNAIESRLNALAKVPAADFVYAPHYEGYSGPDGRILQGALHSVKNYASDELFDALALDCLFHLSTALVRTSVYRKLNGFDNELLSSEDYDLQLQLAHSHVSTYSPEPVFMFRQHAGVRGPRVQRYAGKDRATVFRYSTQTVGLKLRRTVPLLDFLSRKPVSGQASAATQRMALLTRMNVMASKACLDEMFEDLTLALETVGPKDELSQAELELIARSLLTGYADAACRNDAVGFIKRCARVRGLPHGKSAVRALTKSLFKLAKGYPGDFRTRWQRLSLTLRVGALSYL